MHSYFHEEAVRWELPGIILLSHGGLAIGMRETAEIVLGRTDNLAAFSLDPEDDPVSFREAFLRAAAAFPAGVVVFVDMFGGSPCNQLLLGAEEIPVPYCAFSGMNLPLISEAVAMRELCGGEALRTAILAVVPHAIMDLGAKIGELYGTE